MREVVRADPIPGVQRFCDIRALIDSSCAVRVLINDASNPMLTAIKPQQVEEVISLLERISEARNARAAHSTRGSVDEIVDDPKRQDLVNYLYSLDGGARGELIALMLRGRGDIEYAYERALETVSKYTAADDQVTYLMTKAFRLAEYLRIGLAAASK